MTEAAPESPPEPAPPAAEGPLGHAADWFRSHAGHAEAEAGHIAADIATGLREIGRASCRERVYVLV